MAEDAEGNYALRPDIAVIAETPADRARGEAAGRAAGCRVVFATRGFDARSRLDERIGLDAVLLIHSGTERELPDAALERIVDAVRDGSYRAVVAVPFEALYAVHGRVDHRDIEILCDPTDAELVGALGLATIRRVPALNQPGDGEDVQLLRISEEVGRIARALADLSQGESGPGNGRSGLGEAAYAFRAEPPTAGTLDADRIRRVIRMRRLRDRFFEGGLFADPAWDMLLDLMAARLERRDVAVSSLCIAAAVPPTTALRWIKTMTEAGLFERRADPGDGRRIFIALSDEAASAVEAWFAAVRREGGSPVV